jgi:hypothetical protein
MAERVVVVSGRHRPHELLLLVVSLVTGVAYTIGAPPPSSIAALLPDWALHVWSGGLLLSGILGLAGILLRRPYALQLEQAGMLIGAGALVWYSAAVATLGWRALLAGAICLAWAGANLWRAMQIRRDLKGS